MTEYEAVILDRPYHQLGTPSQISCYQLDVSSAAEPSTIVVESTYAIIFFQITIQTDLALSLNWDQGYPNFLVHDHTIPRMV
jgi:hypothetical protein